MLWTKRLHGWRRRNKRWSLRLSLVVTLELRYSILFLVLDLDLILVKIMHRDGFQCVITGVYDVNCKPELQPRGPLDAAHIVEPSLAVFNEKEVGDA